jgi:hypothetical protein
MSFNHLSSSLFNHRLAISCTLDVVHRIKKEIVPRSDIKRAKGALTFTVSDWQGISIPELTECLEEENLRAFRKNVTAQRMKYFDLEDKGETAPEFWLETLDTVEFL